MTARIKTVTPPADPTTVRLYVVTGKAVPYIPLESNVERILHTGAIVPADMTEGQIGHLLHIGLIAAHDVPVNTN